MRKRTLWLARSEGQDGSSLYQRKPKMVKVQREEYICTCERGEDCWMSQKAGTAQMYEGEQVDEFCSDGLQTAGIELKPGEMVKVTLESVR